MQSTEEKRIETDTFGPIEVSSEYYYGAQTARSMHYFNIGLPTGKKPKIIISFFLNS
jgi:fumarate hydratase class II